MEKIIIESSFMDQVESGGLVVAKIDKQLVTDMSHPVSRGYIQLRTEKYRQYGYISPSLSSDINSDDERSDHYVAIEAGDSHLGYIIGTLRMINRDVDDNIPLPIESLFNDTLNGEVTPKAAEISRLIIEHSSQPHGLARTALIQTALKETVSNGTKQTLAMVDPWFRDFLKDKVRIPLSEVTEERKFGKYPEAQVGIDVDFRTLNKRIGVKALAAVFVEDGVEFYKF